MNRFVCDRFFDSAKAHFLFELYHKTNSPLLVVTEGKGDLFYDLTFFLKKEPLELLANESNLDIQGRRLKVLKSLDKSPFFLLSPVKALFDPVAEPTSIPLYTLKKGDSFPFEQFLFLLESLKFSRQKLVIEKGEYALRGGIVDLFPLSSEEPYRIEFFGDEIVSMRTFDPISQRSIQECSSIELIPAKIEENKPLLSILPKETIIVFDQPPLLEDRLILLKQSFKPFLELPNPIYFLFNESLQEVSKVDLRSIGKSYYEGLKSQPIAFEAFNHKIEGELLSPLYCPIEELFEISSAPLTLHESQFRPFSIQLLAASPTEKQLFTSLFPDLPKNAKIEEGYLSQGFLYKQQIFLPYTEWSKRKKIHRQKWRVHHHIPLSEFHELQPGDYVVHIHNGVGRFLGFEKRTNHLNEIDEFLVLEYQGNSKLYVPMAQAHLVSRYIGGKEEEAPHLNQLGTTKWVKTKAKAEKAIVGYAKELLLRAAEREIKGGFIYPSDGELMQAFEEEFPFDETEDQLKAILEIKTDMQSPYAMDRLICGDVGYGKTEVAMRAAVKAVLDGEKQVAVLVPTTILALQHYETFKERLKGFPINIALACRFRTQKEVKESLKETEEGKVDILVGTHRLISKDVVFKNLGLIIIDEEQRFGVRAKEWLKKVTVGVDCLTLSATPIPRTLYLSIVSAKKMSIISSPPSDRLPVKMVIAEDDDALIRSALIHEFARSGQAYFLHNRVETIDKMKDRLQALVPSARVGVVHGQMETDQIDDIFHAFKQGVIDLLIATTIIENGIDIPNANTIFIDRADHFGLSDLYQLKGRVGRSDRSGFAYFLIPKQKTLKEISEQRLKAIVEAPAFGGGLKVAMKDLQMRGAGDLLGVQQTGHISSIGFHLYCKLLKKTIEAMRAHRPLFMEETKIESSFDAKLPSSYINDEALRLELYHRLGEACELEEIDDLFSEIKDRFGKWPLALLWLYHLARIKIKASKKGITLIKFQNVSITIESKKRRRDFLYKPLMHPKEVEQFFDQCLEKFLTSSR